MCSFGRMSPPCCHKTPRHAVTQVILTLDKIERTVDVYVNPISVRIEEPL